MGGYWFSDLEFRVERFRVRGLAGFGVRAWGFSFEGLGFKGRGLGGSRLWDPRVVIENFVNWERKVAWELTGQRLQPWFCRGLVQRFKVSELVVGAFGGIA